MGVPKTDTFHCFWTSLIRSSDLESGDTTAEYLLSCSIFVALNVFHIPVWNTFAGCVEHVRRLCGTRLPVTEHGIWIREPHMEPVSRHTWNSIFCLPWNLIFCPTMEHVFRLVWNPIFGSCGTCFYPETRNPFFDDAVEPDFRLLFFA